MKVFKSLIMILILSCISSKLLQKHQTKLNPRKLENGEVNYDKLFWITLIIFEVIIVIVYILTFVYIKTCSKKIVQPRNTEDYKNIGEVNDQRPTISN